MHINLRGFSALDVFCDLITNLYGDKKMINDNNRNENDEQTIRNESLTWPEAYYPVEDRLVNVEYALNIRAKNGGEYRENPCVHSKTAWERGEGILLTPVDNSLNDKVNFFRAFPNQNDLIENIATSLGIDPIYTNSAIRVSGMIDMLERAFNNDRDIIENMGILSIFVNRNNCNLLQPDIIIKHDGEFQNKYNFKETRLYIRDWGRNPEESERSDWILNITKYEHNIVSDWIKWKLHFSNEWNRYRTRRLAKSVQGSNSRNISGFSLSGIRKNVTINELMAVYCGELLSQEARWFW